MKEICEKYRSQAYFGFLFYGVMTVIAAWAVLKFPLGERRIPVALTPIVPALFIARSIVRLFSIGDELQIKSKCNRSRLRLSERSC